MTTNLRSSHSLPPCLSARTQALSLMIASFLVLPLRFNPTPTPSLFQRAEACQNRDGQNFVDLSNGGGKFMLNGQTLELPGITPTDSRQARIEALRIYLEKQLGP